jgi:hypothetical protein
LPCMYREYGSFRTDVINLKDILSPPLKNTLVFISSLHTSD